MKPMEKTPSKAALPVKQRSRFDLRPDIGQPDRVNRKTNPLNRSGSEKSWLFPTMSEKKPRIRRRFRKDIRQRRFKEFQPEPGSDKP